ncbi:putative transporter [Hyphodiscus hymeniophilus]|uniref:Transporter n=1 Tax=Hyphodiscus hymeniophilus TaxID=353542 RepID=A0A9P6VMY1_9HELO|nr:putative transporter [Hyphodiscus hymeniophilus]
MGARQFRLAREDTSAAIPMRRFGSSRYQPLASGEPSESSSDNSEHDPGQKGAVEFSSEFDLTREGEADAATSFLNSNKSRSSELGVPGTERRFWFQRSKTVYDLDAIATQPSVFDDPETLEDYRPGDEWENTHRFDPEERWTWGEEHRLIRKIDSKIMLFAAIMFMALELDRSNISQALTDNFLDDLGMDTNDYNLGQTAFKFAFLCAELPSQLLAKWIGPDIWIPTQMVVILYLSYFYKHHELSLRLGFFWTASALADVLGGFLAFGLLHLRGVDGKSGWRWLFLIEGLITFFVGLLAYDLMPSSPTSTASWFRGEKGWFTEREEKIMINRVLREDPSKSSMHNREPLTPALLWQSMKDFDLWPIYLLGLNFQTPMTTVMAYLTLSLKGLGFDTFKTNLLVIPSMILHVITMLALTYGAEVWGELTFTALIGQIWALPFLIFINLVDINSINKWFAWIIMTVLLSYPNAHPIQVGWNSRNSNTVRSRTVSAALYNMSVQTSGIIASNIYQKDDAPQYRRGNKVLLSILIGNIFLYLGSKLYYVKRNAYRDRKWNSMDQEKKLIYLATTTDEGNKRLDFRFAH